ncbi:phage portal protein [bacterium]|nr:phage portal protein [bacterium]
MSDENTNTSTTTAETEAVQETVAESSSATVQVAKYPTTLSEIGTFLGREKVTTTTRYIDETNICKVLSKVIPVFERNVNDISFLYNYYRGLQPILNRVKQIRPDICNKIVENHAEEIVSFFTGYIFGDSIIYAGRSEEDCSEEIQKLNAWNAENDADAQNITLGEWLNICGLGFKMALPRRDSIVDTSEMTSPYITTVLDPREACVVYYNGIQEVPVLGFKVIDTRNTDALYNKLYCCYTETGYYEIPDTEILSGRIPVRMNNPIGKVPIVEYPANIARRGRLEPVIPIMDALNILASNRLDGVEQFIQSILLFRNVDVDSTDVDRLNAMGAIKYKDVDPQTPGEVRYITAELNQEGAQTLKDDLYESLLIISGMPNRNGGNSTSDTGTAVIYRDGFFAAETKAKAMEKFYTRSEKELLKVILRIVGAVNGFNLHLANIEVKFTRKNYENTLVKSQVLTTMLSNEKIAPRLAFVYSGLFSDPEAAWKESMLYYDSNKEKEETEVSTNGESSTDAGNNTGNRTGAEQGLSS